MTEQERDELLLSLKSDMQALRDEVQGKQETMQNDLEKMQSKQETMQSNLETMQTNLEVMQASLGSMESQFSDIKKELRSISGSIASMEVLHGEKIQAIFDIIKEPLDKAYAVRAEVDSHENRLDEHDVRIRVLESKVI